MAIASFRHRELKKLYNGKKARLDAAWIDVLLIIFDALDSMGSVDDLKGFRGFHALTGNRKGHYSLKVTANWRLTFTFDGTDAHDLDLEDYH